MVSSEKKMKNIRLICILLAVPALLLVPFVATKFTNEVNWTALDFTVMGIMLLVTGISVEVAMRIVRVPWIRIAAVAAILFGFVMVWGALVHLGG